MPTLTLSGYERRHRDAVLDLVFDHIQSHTHLDWYMADEWLDHHAGAISLAWQNRRLMGVMGFSVPLHDTVWMRLLAVRDAAPTRDVLRALWDDARVLLTAQRVKSASLLMFADWVGAYTADFGMGQVEMVVTMKRNGGDLPRQLNIRPILHPAEYEDLPTMISIDHAAFAPPWQLAPDDLRAALRIASSCKLAYVDGRVVGYQLSTRYDDNGHLARLAVLPDAQGIGVGGALLHDLLHNLMRRRVKTITVNTQLSNLRSQRLYSAYGFRRNGYDLPVFSMNL